jgi:hypothetical protein
VQVLSLGGFEVASWNSRGGVRKVGRPEGTFHIRLPTQEAETHDLCDTPDCFRLSDGLYRKPAEHLVKELALKLFCSLPSSHPPLTVLNRHVHPISGETRSI